MKDFRNKYKSFNLYKTKLMFDVRVNTINASLTYGINQVSEEDAFVEGNFVEVINNTFEDPGDFVAHFDGFDEHDVMVFASHDNKHVISVNSLVANMEDTISTDGPDSNKKDNSTTDEESVLDKVTRDGDVITCHFSTK